MGGCKQQQWKAWKRHKAQFIQQGGRCKNREKPAALNSSKAETPASEGTGSLTEVYLPVCTWGDI